ncbi:MAG: HD domain-containing protein [Bacteroidales bacterium]|nr:HD domain-containing protein [Bacteroidales bacterium]
MTAQTTITEEERQKIKTAYKNLLASTAELREPDDIRKIREIFLKASERVDLTRYKAQEFSSLRHSFEITQIVVDEIGLGRVAAICAVLYETVQASGLEINIVKDAFGEQIANICEGLTKVCELYQKHGAVDNENFRKLLFTFAQDVRVILVILSDRLNLMRHLKLFPEIDQKMIGSEVGYLYAPMAHRMGLYGMKSEMEDLSMKFTNREVYLDIARQLNETKKSRDAYIESFLSPLRKVLDETGLTYEMKGRTKTISSIYNKLQKSHANIESIYDLFAIRIIIDCDLKNEKAECWRVYSIVTDMYQPNPVRLKDWISIPKGNGYESLHITVLGPDKRWVEVQIRTKRMDEVAEKGFCAHWKYKGIKTEDTMEKWLANIREVLENPELTGVDFIDDFKLNLYDKEVFVFTPKGDLRRLAKGATVLDFAFDIHSNVGSKCVGAIVNDRNVPIKYVLQNGDQVEILTSNHQEPKQDWLQIAATSRTKAKLRKLLNEQKYKQSEIGREMLERRLKNWKMELNDTLLHLLIKAFGYKDMQSFLCDIGNDKISAQDIKDKLTEEDEKKEQLDPPVKVSTSEYKQREDEPEEMGNGGVLMLDKSLTNIGFTLSKCCNPIFGDPVFAFVSATGGVKIHRKGCPNEAEMMRRFGYRILDAKWNGTGGNLMPVTLRVTGNDDLGILTNISQVLTKDSGVKVRNITVNTTEGGFEGDVTVMVSNTELLSGLIKKVKAIKGVYSVVRLEK